MDGDLRMRTLLGMRGFSPIACSVAMVVALPPSTNENAILELFAQRIRLKLDLGLIANPAVRQKACHHDRQPAFEIRVVGRAVGGLQLDFPTWLQPNRNVADLDAGARRFDALECERPGLRVPDREPCLGYFFRIDDFEYDRVRADREREIATRRICRS